MVTKSSHIQVSDYWLGIQEALDQKLKAVRKYLRHPSSGHNAESYFGELIRTYLPTRYSVESGFVVNAAGNRSDHIDLLIVDRHNIPPLSAEAYFKVFPAEAVVGAVEITSAPKARIKFGGSSGTIDKIQDDILKLAKLREIARDREYVRDAFDSHVQPIGSGPKVKLQLSPRSFLITCGDEWSKPTTYQGHLISALKGAQKHATGRVWVNAVLSMQHGMFYFERYTEFTCTRVADNPLLEFILFVNEAISSFPGSRIDLRRYRTSLPMVPKED